MSIHHISRRHALILGAAATLPWAGNTARAATAPRTVGLSTLGFPGFTNAELAQELAAQGIHTIQLFLNQSDSRFWAYNGRSDLSELGMEQCAAIAKTYRDAGVAIHSIGVYTNFVHPDAEERAANLAYFEGMMKVGAAMGVRTFVTESGHYEPEGPATRTAYHFEADVWPRTVETFKQLAQRAEQYDATVLLEGYFGSFFASAKRLRVFVEEVASPRIRVLLDPANLLELNDLNEMFAQLSPYIDCIHAKDRKLHVEAGVAAGQGDIDYAELVRLAAEHTPHAPLILEYVGPDNYKQSLAYLEKFR